MIIEYYFLSFFIIFNLINDELRNFKENFYSLSTINYPLNFI